MTTKLYQRIYDDNWNVIAEWWNTFFINDFFVSQLGEPEDDPLDFEVYIDYEDIEHLLPLVYDCAQEIAENGEAKFKCTEIFPTHFYNDDYAEEMFYTVSRLLLVMYNMKTADDDIGFHYKATVEKK